jgi:hypothetical protein
MAVQIRLLLHISFLYKSSRIVPRSYIATRNSQGVAHSGNFNPEFVS